MGIVLEDKPEDAVHQLAPAVVESLDAWAAADVGMASAWVEGLVYRLQDILRAQRPGEDEYEG